MKDLDQKIAAAALAGLCIVGAPAVAHAQGPVDQATVVSRAGDHIGMLDLHEGDRLSDGDHIGMLDLHEGD